MTIPDQLRELECALRASLRLMRCLRAVRTLELPEAYIAAGAIRNTYWAYRHDRSLDDVGGDVDVIFFDQTRTRDDEAQLERALALLVTHVTWEVTNQAHVHEWYEAYAGVPTRPLRSSIDGISTFPELATCVGARITSLDTVEIVAPHGLDDLVGMRWRRNPYVSAGAFTRRLAARDVAREWPRVQVTPET